jgi:hypothetical protein
MPRQLSTDCGLTNLDAELEQFATVRRLRQNGLAELVRTEQVTDSPFVSPCGVIAIASRCESLCDVIRSVARFTSIDGGIEAALVRATPRTKGRLRGAEGGGRHHQYIRV